MSSDENVKAILILDIIGRPPEYLVENLERIVGEMGKEEGVKVVSKEIKEPVIMKGDKGFYTTFGEIEVETKDILYLAMLMFKYMPAHIEVIFPESIALSNNGWGDILSELVRRLHSYDEISRILQIEKEDLLKKVQELGGTEKPKTKSKEKTSKKK